MDVKEDKEDTEEFVPKPYAGRTTAGSKAKKTTTKKTPAKKPAEKKEEKKEPADNGQISFMEQLSLENMLAPEKKAG
jgi:U3 small nucleolar ribonucleoprotein component